MDLLDELILFSLWIGLWGMTDAIIDIYARKDEHAKRIKIFAAIFIFSLIVLSVRGTTYPHQFPN